MTELCLAIDHSDGLTPEPSVCLQLDRSHMEIVFLRIDLGDEMCVSLRKILSDTAPGGQDGAEKRKTTYGSVAHTLIRMRC